MLSEILIICLRIICWGLITHQFACIVWLDHEGPDMTLGFQTTLLCSKPCSADHVIWSGSAKPAVFAPLSSIQLHHDSDTQGATYLWRQAAVRSLEKMMLWSSHDEQEWWQWFPYWQNIAAAMRASVYSLNWMTEVSLPLQTFGISSADNVSPSQPQCHCVWHEPRIRVLWLNLGCW